MDIALTSVQKLQKCITDGWKLISFELQNYCKAVNLAKSHTSIILAHKCTLNNIASANIEETELFQIEPEIKCKLQRCIQGKIITQEMAISKILKELTKCYATIMASIEKIENACEKDLTDNLNRNETLKGSETSLSIAEMLEGLHRLKYFFTNSQIQRKWFFDLMHCGILDFVDDEKISSIWDVSELLSLKQDLDFSLSVE